MVGPDQLIPPHCPYRGDPVVAGFVLDVVLVEVLVDLRLLEVVVVLIELLADLEETVDVVLWTEEEELLGLMGLGPLMFEIPLVCRVVGKRG